MHNSQTKRELKPIWLFCLKDFFEKAIRNKQKKIEISSLEIQHRAESIFQKKFPNCFPSICSAMRFVRDKDIDKIVKDTESHNSSTYTINYKLPRTKPIEVKTINNINISDNPTRIIKIKQKQVNNELNKKIININDPTVSEIKSYLEKWKGMEKYVLQEKALNKLFIETYPKNVDINDILIKVCTLNDFYSTKIFEPLVVARHIKNLDIDMKLKQNDISLVNEIAQVKMEKDKIKYFYSFATKYCSFHKPDIYPIYYNYVESALKYFNKNNKFYDFKNNDYKDYQNFLKIVLLFKDKFNLKIFSFKEIDKYLWQVGRDNFTRNYKKNRKWKS